jgi:hypothetical protein
VSDVGAGTIPPLSGHDDEESHDRRRVTERKTRLFAAAGCRSIASWLYDPRCLRAVEVCEAYADGLVGEDELEAACDEARFETGPPDERQGTVIGSMASAATHWIC